MITAEQFAEWKEHPVTREVYEELKKVKDELTAQLADGVTLGHSAESTHGMTNHMIGHLAGLNQLLNISFDDSKKIEDLTVIDERSGY